MKLVLALFSIAASTIFGQTRPTPRPSVEAEIRLADEEFMKAIASKSVEQTVAMYDAEVLTAGSAMPPARGIAQIRAVWTRFFAQPDFLLTWRTEKVVITESGTIASSSGIWRGAKPEETGPCLVVWRKQQDGKWKILIDSAWTSRTPE